MFNPTILTKIFAPRRQGCKHLFTAETQSTQRVELLPNRETAIGQKSWSLEEACFCLSLFPDKQKTNSLKSLSAIICENLRLRILCVFLCVLCVSAVKFPNPYLRKSAVSVFFLTWPPLRLCARNRYLSLAFLLSPGN
jgi:hypothetical protein